MAETGLLNALHRRKLVLTAAALLVLITSLPQIFLCFARGPDWNGSCAYLDTDELAYSAYVNALIDGRPRRNDPYTAKDNNRFETLFSIQFLPAYVVALPARLLGFSASTAFIILQVAATVAAALMVVWLLFELTNDLGLASLGAVGVLCLGTIAATNPLHIFSGVQVGYDLLPFLRRYVPAVPFPIFIALSLFTWRALTRSAAWAILAGLAFAFLVYSYFFLWTAAAAWLFTVMITWLIGRSEDRSIVFKVSGILVGMGIVALLPYWWLLMNRAITVDRSQLLQLTHAPDLLRVPEIYGAVILVFLVNYARKRNRIRRDPKILFTVSFLIVPFLIFNQQILTGRSLQSFHYEEFVTNYWIVLAFFLALGLCWRNLSRRIRIYLTVGTILIGLVVGVRAARTTLDTNIKLDKSRAVALKLRESPQDGTVFTSDILLTHSLASTARNPVLWARHLYTFSNVDLVEQKKRFYQYLYYSGFNEKQFAATLHTDFTARWEVFGAERANPVLAAGHKEITEKEIINAVEEYAAFANSFDLRLAEYPLLAYAVVSPNDDLSNLDRWYERSQPTIIGEFIVYPLTLRHTK